MARAYTVRNGHKDPWTDEERRFIRENYMEMSDSEMSNHLGKRSPSAIRSMLQQLKLNRDIVYNAEIVIRSVFKDTAFSTPDHIKKLLDK